MLTVEIGKNPEISTRVNAKYCNTFLSKFIGLMFSKELKRDRGIILVENQESRINSSIHMLFMNYDITVLWLDERLVIVDKVLARKWRPMYLPKVPAQYVVELHQSRFSEFSIGDQLFFQA
ncbi:MAG TPA: DUF192 domain-containing protein [Anaerolineaceae bacterium]|nr:DUF192 domain-containing protein [Anaerolineaceae bacterium]